MEMLPSSDSDNVAQQLRLASPEKKIARPLMQDLIRKVVHTGGSKGYEVIVGLITLVITARLLGPEGRGIFAAVTTWVSLFFTVGYFSLDQVTLHFATQNRNNNWLGSVLGSLLCFTACITCLGWFIAAVMFWSSDGLSFGNLPFWALFLGFLSLPFLIWEQYGRALLISVDRLEVVNYVRITARTVGVILLVVLLWSGTGLFGALVATLCGNIIVAVVGVRYLFRQSANKVRPDKETLRHLMVGGLKLHLNAVGAILFTSANVIIVNHFSGAQETGYYHLAVKLIVVMMVIPQSALLVLNSKMAQLGPDGLWPYQRKVILALMLVMATLSAIAAMAAPWGIPFIAGKEFAPAVGLFRYLLIALIGMTFSTAMTNQWIGRGLFIQASVVTLMTGVLNVIANFLLVPKYGAYGAVWATVGTFAIELLTNGWLVMECEKRRSR